MKSVSKLKTGTWWKCAAIRAVRTVAQAAVAGIGTAAILESTDWKYVVSAALLAGVLSMLTSIAALPEAETEKS